MISDKFIQLQTKRRRRNDGGAVLPVDSSQTESALMEHQLTAITHLPSATLANCLLTFLDTQPIDIPLAQQQHRRYRELFSRHGVGVVSLTENSALPDAVFVEDTAVVLPELAIITPMGAPQRRAETALIAAALAPYRPVAYIQPPARLEGGDVLRIGRSLFVGLSQRTNAAGIAALQALVEPRGYTVTGVPVHGCLHLKTGCTALDGHQLLVNPDWIDTTPLQNYSLLPVPEMEPFAANILQLGNTICMPAAFPRSRRLIESLGFTVETVDISEFQKAEAGLTCMSLLLTDS